jgi:hypothetical protein
MGLLVKDAQNANQTLKTISAGTGLVTYNNEEADFFLRVSRGNETGLEVIKAWGENPTVTTASAGAEEDLWGPAGQVTYLSSATLLTLSSSSANDTSAGSGLRTVLVTGVGTSHIELSETVTMAGASLVSTSNQYLRINSVEAVTVGATGYNEGLVSVQTVVGSPDETIATMPIARNSLTNVHYTVPVGKTAFIRTMFGSAIEGVSIRYHFLMRNSVADSPFVPISSFMDVTSAFRERNFSLFEAVVPATYDIVMRAERVDTSGATPAVGGFSALLVSDTEVLG